MSNTPEDINQSIDELLAECIAGPRPVRLEFPKDLFPLGPHPYLASHDTVPEDAAVFAQTLRNFMRKYGLTGKGRHPTDCPNVSSSPRGYFTARITVVAWQAGTATTFQRVFISEREERAHAYWDARLATVSAVKHLARYHTLAKQMGYNTGANELKYTLCREGVPLTQTQLAELDAAYKALPKD